MTAVRGFARYLAGIDARTEVPPPGLIRIPRSWRAAVHLRRRRRAGADGRRSPLN
jgi:hypothetical protein